MLFWLNEGSNNTDIILLGLLGYLTSMSISKESLCLPKPCGLLLHVSVTLCLRIYCHQDSNYPLICVCNPSTIALPTIIALQQSLPSSSYCHDITSYVH